MPPFTGYLAAAGFEEQLAAELGGGVASRHGRLLLAEGEPRPAAWAQNVWLAPERLEVASVADAARRLRGMQRGWALYSVAHHRRARLIEEQLPHVSFRPLAFGEPAPAAPLGSWTLLEPGVVLASARCSSPFRHGEVCFAEDKEGPPSRAYLKLWELFTLLGARPQPGERCVDLGASPGGWTWVLAELGAQVTSVDKAPLDPRVGARPNVEQCLESAFGVAPTSLGAVDWLFADVACYPERLLRLVETWLAAGTARRIVCTLKFQAETDHAIARRFAAIPGSSLRHLSHNKHELTWTWGV